MSELSKKIIGLTGSIASGKSIVSNYLKDKGYQVIDADLIVKDLYENNEYLKREIVKVFSDNVVVNNKIDKKKISNLVFKDDLLLNKLNNIIHPLVIKKIITEINEKDGLIFLDIPLLFETGIDKICDVIIVIDVDDDIRLSRLLNRDEITYEKALSIDKKQMSSDLKKIQADYLINNNSDINNLYQEIENVLLKLKEND